MIFDKIKSQSSTMLYLVCVYIFLLIERPWESIGVFENIPMQFPYAVLMISVALFSGKFKIIRSSTNKWVYSLLGLHLILVPFSFDSQFAIDQSYEYAKSILIYMLMLVVVDDEYSLKAIVNVFILSMFLYMSHSIWEYCNGRHVYRMGITRLIGVDSTSNDPNAFGASIVLSLPFVYALLRCEVETIIRKFYYSYFSLAIICLILTGSRSAAVAFVVLLLLWSISQKGWKKIWFIVIVSISLGIVWSAMPDEKRERVRTLWDKDAGPEAAYGSAQGRLQGWLVSWEMFKQKPLTGVGPGGKNFIGYRVAHNVDETIGLPPKALQSHNLYGQVLAEFGIPGALLFIGLVFSTWKNSSIVLRKLKTYSTEEEHFLRSFSKAIITSLLLLLLLGLAGHNFYRLLWLWSAAWSGSLVLIVEAKFAHKFCDLPKGYLNP